MEFRSILNWFLLPLFPLWVREDHRACSGALAGVLPASAVESAVALCSLCLSLPWAALGLFWLCPCWDSCECPDRGQFELVYFLHLHLLSFLGEGGCFNWAFKWKQELSILQNIGKKKLGSPPLPTCSSWIETMFCFLWTFMRPLFALSVQHFAFRKHSYLWNHVVV